MMADCSFPNLIYISLIAICFAGNCYGKHNHTCLKLLNEYAEKNSEFVRCALQNAEPVKYCQSCVEHYLSSEESFENLAKATDSENNKTCHSEYFNLDRLNIIEVMYKNVADMWNAGSCNNCFNLTNVTNHKPDLSVTAIEFVRLYNLTFDCMHDSNKTTVCEDCAGKYGDLNKFYESVKESFIDNICFDIKDVMNKTRYHWSGDLKCCKDRNTSKTAFIAVSSVFSLIPLGFYLGIIYHGRRRDRSIILSDETIHRYGTRPAATSNVAAQAIEEDNELIDDELEEEQPNKLMNSDGHSLFDDSDSDSSNDDDVLNMRTPKYELESNRIE